MKQQRKCGDCKETFPKSQITRINKMWRCIFCTRKKRKDHREHLKRNVLGIRKRSDILIEVRERREEKRKMSGNFSLPLEKVRMKKRTPGLGFYLTKLEWQVLNQKYTNQGWSYKEANQKVKGIREYLINFVQKLREEKKSEEELDIRFKEEFARLCEI